MALHAWVRRVVGARTAEAAAAATTTTTTATATGHHRHHQGKGQGTPHAAAHEAKGSVRRVLEAQTRLLRETLGEEAVERHVRAVPRHAGLNAVRIGDAKTGKGAVVVLHGYGSGLGFFFPQMRAAVAEADHTRRNVYFVDWLGCGGSDRPADALPKLSAWCSSTPRETSSEKAVSFFVDPLREWFRAEGITNAVLVGHSLGGYLSARFALTHANSLTAEPEKRLVKRLVLASPAGMPSWSEDPASPGSATTSSSSPSSRAGASRSTAAGLGVALLDGLWSANVTPQRIVRMMGEERGRSLVHRALAGRLGLDPRTHGSLPAVMSDYLFELTVAPPSGEFALNALLRPPFRSGALTARVPLHDALPRGPDRRSKRAFSLDVVFGDRDWLGTPPALAAALAVADHTAVLPKAGHHLYMDAAREFSRLVLQQ